MRSLIHPCCLAAAFALNACGHAPEESREATRPKGEVWLTTDQVRQTQMKIEPVEVRSIGDKIVTGAKIAFDDLRVSHVYSPVTGRVSKIFVDFGQRVKKGDPLATIESPDYASAYSDVIKASADLTAAQHDVKRQHELAAAHATAQALVELSEDNFLKAQAEMQRAELKTKLLHGGSSIEAVSQGFVLRAPLDGEVVARNVNPGIVVQGMLSGANIANELFTIGSIDKVWLLADLYESQLGKAKPGDQVDITTVTYPEVFHGVVDYVSDVLDPATRTAHLRCSIDNPDHKLKPEMFVTAAVHTGERSAIAVPRAAVLKISEQYVVFVQVGQTESGQLRFVAKPVRVGDEDDGFVEITEGLKVGDSLVTEGAILLSTQA